MPATTDLTTWNHALELLDFTFFHVKTIGECWIIELAKSACAA